MDDSEVLYSDILPRIQHGGQETLRPSLLEPSHLPKHIC